MARVLVVEDDDVVRDVVTSHLRGSGHDVLEATTGRAALAAVEERGVPDVAVLDVGLPDTDGFALMAGLHDRIGAPPVTIFLSGRVEDDDVDAGRARGCLYLTKPFVASVLLEAIDRLTAVAVPAQVGASAQPRSADPRSAHAGQSS